MKRNNIILLVLLCVSIFSSCKEEEAHLQFSVELNSNPGAIKIDYSSPDPLHVEKEYRISTDNAAGVLTLVCDNASSLYFDSGNNSEDSSYYVNETTGWSAEITDGKLIKFIFNETDLNPDLTLNDLSTILIVYGNTGKKVELSRIHVYRDLYGK